MNHTRIFDHHKYGQITAMLFTDGDTEHHVAVFVYLDGSTVMFSRMYSSYAVAAVMLNKLDMDFLNILLDGELPAGWEQIS